MGTDATPHTTPYKTGHDWRGLRVEPEYDLDGERVGFLPWLRKKKLQYSDSYTELAAVLRIDEAQLRRWCAGTIKNKDGLIAIARIDELLINEGSSTKLWDLYPDEHAPVIDRYCPTCAQQPDGDDGHVSTGGDLICPWCETETLTAAPPATTLEPILAEEIYPATPTLSPALVAEAAALVDAGHSHEAAAELLLLLAAGYNDTRQLAAALREELAPAGTAAGAIGDHHRPREQLVAA